MVARLEPVKSISRPLLYNEEKVSQNRAELLLAQNFLKEKDKLSYADKLHRFRHLNELNTRSKVRMLHATLNFSPADKLSDERLTAIADRYMEGLKMDHQPYLVYKHTDAKHPHLHIVTSLIQPDGKRIDTDRMAVRLSEPTRKAIQQEFNLTPAQRRKNKKIAAPDELQKVSGIQKLPVSESIDRIVASVSKHYDFSSLHELNAILRGYNVTAETGSLGSKTRRHNGLYYVALNDQGKRISPPVMASELPGRPTLSRLNDKFHTPGPNHLDHLTSIRQRIDWTLDHRPKNLPSLVTMLQRDNIEIIISPRNGRNAHDHIFVDHRTHTAVTGERLGAAYTAEAVAHTIGQHPQKIQLQYQKTPDREISRPYDRQQKQRQPPPHIPFSANVPQVLSSLLNTRPGDAGPDAFSQGERLGRRPKR